MAIMENEVWVSLSSTVIPYYEGLNYEIPRYIDNQKRLKVKRGTKILVRTNYLPELSNIKLTKICDVCGIKIKNQIYSNIIKHRKRSDGLDRCSKCGKVHMQEKRKNKIPYDNSLEYYIKNNQKYFHLVSEFGDNEKLLSQISKCTSDEYWWNCPKCKSRYKMSVSKRVNGRNCSYCAGYKVNHTNSLESKDPTLAKEWHPTKNKKLTPSQVTCGNNNKAWWKCSECNHEWEAIISNRSRLKRGCPVCKESKGEKKIREWLKSNLIEFEAQKEFENLIGIGEGLLSYDFYLPKQNILIEYQGEFHDGSGGEYTNAKLEYQKEHDKRKKEYAKQNRIELLEVWYWDFNNVGEILNKALGGVE